MGVRSPAIDVELVRGVGAAVRQRLVLRLTYHCDPAPRQLEVQAHQLVVWASRWYLVAYDVREPGWRVLRLERITLGAPTNRTFADRGGPPGGAAEFVRVSAERGDLLASWPCQGSARLPLPAETIAPYVPGGGVVEALDEHSCRLSLGAWSWSGLAGLFLTFATRLDDVQPAELRGAFVTLAETASAAGRPPH